METPDFVVKMRLYTNPCVTYVNGNMLILLFRILHTNRHINKPCLQFISTSSDVDSGHPCVMATPSPFIISLLSDDESENMSPDQKRDGRAGSESLCLTPPSDNVTDCVAGIADIELCTSPPPTRIASAYRTPNTPRHTPMTPPPHPPPHPNRSNFSTPRFSLLPAHATAPTTLTPSRRGMTPTGIQPIRLMTGSTYSGLTPQKATPHKPNSKRKKYTPEEDEHILKFVLQKTGDSMATYSRVADWETLASEWTGMGFHERSAKSLSDRHRVLRSLADEHHLLYIIALRCGDCAIDPDDEPVYVGESTFPGHRNCQHNRLVKGGAQETEKRTCDRCGGQNTEWVFRMTIWFANTDRMEGDDVVWSKEEISAITKSFEHWVRHTNVVTLPDQAPVSFYESDARTHDEWEVFLRRALDEDAEVETMGTDHRFRNKDLVAWKEMKLNLSLCLYRLGKEYAGVPLQITWWGRASLTDIVFPPNPMTNYCLCQLSRFGQDDIMRIIREKKGRRNCSVKDILSEAQRFDLY